MSTPGSLPLQRHDLQLKVKDALVLIGPYLYSNDIARCCLVCRSWSEYFKPLLWWNAIQRVDTQFHRQNMRTKTKTMRQSQKRRQQQQQQQQQEQQQPKAAMSEELFEEIFLLYFQYNFERRDWGTIQACVEFKTRSKWAVEILEASGCDTLQRLDIRCYGYHQLSPTGMRLHNQKIKEIIQRNENLHHATLNIRKSQYESGHWNELATVSPEQSLASTVTPTSSKLEIPPPPIPISSSLKTIVLFDSLLEITTIMDMISLSSALETFEIRLTMCPHQYSELKEAPTLPSLKPYKSSMRTLNIISTDIYHPNWELWPILYCSPNLKSIRWKCVHFLDPSPPLTQPHEGSPSKAPTTAAPTLHPNLVYLEGVTSITIETCTMEKEQLLYILTACPNLEQLRLVDIELADQNMEEPFWFFPTSVVTPNSSPSASSPDQVNQQPISPSDAYFKNLKRVALIGFRGKYISAHEQVQFLRSLPALESIEFGIGGYCAVYAVYESPKWQPKPSTGAARIPDFQFEKVKTFDVTLKIAPRPRKLARIFELFPPGKCTSVHFYRQQRNYTFHRYDAEHTGETFDPEWPRGLLLHKDTLRDVSIQDSELSSLGPTLLEILRNCPRLRRLEVMDRTSIALKCTVDNLSVPWVCSELEILDVFMDCTHSNGFPSGANNNLFGIDMITPSFLQTQRVLFERLASLPNLRKLAICRGGGNIPSVDFSLKTGLGMLSTLTKLEELDVRVIRIPEGESTLFLDDDVVYRVCENLSIEDAVWMVEHWPALKVVRGMQWNDGTTILKKMLTEQRSDIVFDGY